jgi:arylformamidase
MCVHNGTHIDAPNHFISNGKAVHELDLTRFYGECTVVEFSGMITPDDIAPILKKCHKRLLIKGDCVLSDSAALTIADSHVCLIGMENQSVGSIENPMDSHIALLEKEIVLLEGLDLSDVVVGEYILSAFPLKMQGADGSPVRAVLIEVFG